MRRRTSFLPTEKPSFLSCLTSFWCRFQASEYANVDSGHDGLPAQLLVHGSFCGFVVDLGPLDVHQLTLPPDREFTGLLKEAWGSGVQPRESSPEENLAPALTDRWS